MTLEPDPAAVLMHERLQQAVSSMRAPDVEAGWAALAMQLEAPIAPVVPLRKPSRGRFVALVVAAALVVAGSAFAAVSHLGVPPSDPIAPAVSPVHTSVTGPHAHAPFSGPPAERRSRPHHEHGGTRNGGTSGAGDGGGVTNTGGGDGTSKPRGGTSKPGDDPNDRDQGTGNDGQHNDHGGGNDGPEGTHPGTSRGSSHGGSDH